MSAACGALIAALPACKVLVIVSSIAFAGALGAYALGVVALRRARLRRLAGDPYRYPFGDPTPPHQMMRSYFPALDEAGR